jgi:hypothetical protein
MRKNIENLLINNRVPIIGFNFNFSSIDSNSLLDGRMSTDSINGKLIDNNLDIPYSQHKVNYFGLMKEGFYSNISYVINFNESNILQNEIITNYNIKLTDITEKKNYNLIFGTEIPIKFIIEGEHLLKIEVEINGSKTFYIQKISVANKRKDRSSVADCLPTVELLESIIPFQGYDENIATTTFIDYHIYYHHLSLIDPQCEPILKRPILFLDGFDPQNTRAYDKLVANYLVNVDNKNINLKNELTKQGYDVIVVNFPKLGDTIFYEDWTPQNNHYKIIPHIVHDASNAIVTLGNRDGGADFIERNSMGLVALIQHLNGILATNAITSGTQPEELVIIGPSMGGQIARYALTFMEGQENIGVPDMDHKTRCYISFDSPHDGANIAISVQQTLDYLGNFTHNQDALDRFNM